MKLWLNRYPLLKDGLGIAGFILCVLVGTLIINAFIFRSYNVIGPSMEPTMYTNDRLIVNRIPVSWAHIQGKEYTPNRGDVVVFKNPRYVAGGGDEHIVKRVIAFPGERVVVENGKLTVYNDDYPRGFNPDDSFRDSPGSPTSGNVNTIVTDGTIFVSGDHREGDYSFDSRSGLGLIPLYDIVGPVSLRIYPFTAMRTF